MRKIQTLAISFAFMAAMSTSASAQRFSDESECINVVSGTCNNYLIYGWDTYQDCYDNNIWFCGEIGTGGGPMVVITGPRCVSSSGIQLC